MDDPTAATFIAGGAAVCGNVASALGDQFIIRLLTRKGLTEKAANVAFILLQ